MVVDTNVTISAVMFGGLPGVVLQIGLSRACQLVVSEELLQELDEKLRSKFGTGREEAAAIQAKLRSAALVVAPDLVLDAIPDDPDDNRVLECAIAGRADVIVSGDRHLLRMVRFRDIPIVRARQFLEAMGWQEPVG